LDANRHGLVHTNQELMAPNSVSILILKHRHGLVGTIGLPIVPTVLDCPIISPDCECCWSIGKALL